MALSRLWVRNYRSLVEFWLEPGALTVVVGENGSGKTNLYRALRLIRAGADARLAETLLDEGGMPSILFAGQRVQRKGEPVRVVIGATVEEYSYELALGLPRPDGDSRFSLDPEVKQEYIWFGRKRTTKTVLADRAGSTAFLRDTEGASVTYPALLDPAEPLLAQIGDPARFPEIFALRHHLSRWRFYHEFPTASSAPARSARVGVRTPVLADDGRDLAAAIATIEEIGDGHTFRSAIDRAFPGSRVEIDGSEGVFSLNLLQPGLRRPTKAIELSDGTLRFLYLATALLSPRPPGLLVLNEPETGLHDPVLEPLSELIAVAADFTQVLVTTHSELLAHNLARRGATNVTLCRSSSGATLIRQGDDEPSGPAP